MSQQNVIEKPRTQSPTPRIEQERTERRRRQDTGVGRMLNLSVNGHLDENYTYRWINDDAGRVHQLTKADDWDIVTSEMLRSNDARDKGVGSGVERVVDKVTGKKAVLVRKLREYYVADKAKEQASLDEIESALKRGQTQSPEGLAGPQAYVPQGGISIQNGFKA